MPNPHGTPLWYELLVRDPDQAKRFYDAVLPWMVEDKPSGEMDYRMIDANGEGLVGGVMRLDDDMAAAGAKPGWMFYIGVDDVDDSVAALTAAGGKVCRGPWEIPGVGKIAVVTDPQGAFFYLMRAGRDETSRAFDPDGVGKGAWNELTTTDQAGGHAFYAEMFGWSFADKMSMKELGDYVFIDAPRGRVGATMPPMHPGIPSHWRFYFRVSDLDGSAAAITKSGGTVHMGPMPVPSGERIVVAADPEGAVFGLVSR